jgi:hypothetical protein
MRRRLAVVLVDALGWELAARSPGFAAALPYRRRVETILGFSSGALPTLFTGKMPSDHGRWLMYRRPRRATSQGARAPGRQASAPDTPFRGFHWLGLLPPRLRRSWKLSVLLTRLVARRGVRGYFSLYEVPRELLEDFDLAEREDLFAPGGLPGGALWDTLDSAGLAWRRWNWRTPERENLEAMARALEDGPEDFLFCYTAELDSLLHREGSRGSDVQERMALYDAWISRVCRAAEQRNEELRLVLLSDHGMVDVHRTVDMMATVSRLSCRWPRDYVPFFDSTFARFWWRSSFAREEVRAALAGLDCGHWLEEDELARAGALFPAREYGEDIYLLDPGVLMLPSFMGSHRVAAMHGYDPAHPEMAALLFSNLPVPDEVRHLRDVRSFLEGELLRPHGGS